jgi:hypothetical protein
MFRVPRDGVRPSFDEAFSVSFWKWLTSNKYERREWQRRRNLAADRARVNQNEVVWRAVRNRAAEQMQRQVARGKMTYEQMDANLRRIDEARPVRST